VVHIVKFGILNTIQPEANVLSFDQIALSLKAWPILKSFAILLKI